MENFIEVVGWAPIGPAAAKADGNFIAEYTTGVETPGNAGVGKAHAGRAARAAKDGLRALRRSQWMTQFEKVAFIILTTGRVPPSSRSSSEYQWLSNVTRQVRGIGSSERRPLDGQQTGLIMRLGAFPSTHEEKWWTKLNGVVDFINKNHSHPKKSKEKDS